MQRDLYEKHSVEQHYIHKQCAEHKGVITRAVVVNDTNCFGGVLPTIPTHDPGTGWASTSY